jgi:hypothetical protein
MSRNIGSLFLAVILMVGAVFVMFDQRVSFSNLSSWTSGDYVNPPN